MKTIKEKSWIRGRKKRGEAMKIDFLNVGYGEAVVIRSDSGFTLLVDGGSGRDEVYGEPDTIRLSEFLRAEHIERIDRMLITHIHDDHIGGLVSVAENWPVGEIWCNICPEGDFAAAASNMARAAAQNQSGALYRSAVESYARIRQAAQARGIPMRAACGGERHECGGLTLRLFGMNPMQMAAYEREFEEMLATSDAEVFSKRFYESDFICNRNSLALWVGEGDFSALLTGDKVYGWEALRRSCDLKADVLKITHHGQRDGMPPDMLYGAEPSYIVVCADKNRTFDSASPEVLQRAEQYLAEQGHSGRRIFVTGALQEEAQNGLVLSFSWDENKKCTKALVKTYEK